MRNLKSQIWYLEPEILIMKYEIWIMKSDIWNLEYECGNLICEIWDLKDGIWNMEQAAQSVVLLSGSCQARVCKFGNGIVKME